MSDEDKQKPISKEISKEEWMLKMDNNPFSQSQMNSMIMDYLVTEGFKTVAETFKSEAAVVEPIDMPSLDGRIIIREAVQNGMIQLAIHVANQLHPELLEKDRQLLFQLQNQQLIEMIRLAKIDKALTFAQITLMEPAGSVPGAAEELERTMTLLAFENPLESPFAQLLSQSQRDKVANDLNIALINCKYSANSKPDILFLLKLIQWSQSKLDSKDVNYPKMVKLETAQIETKKNK